MPPPAAPAERVQRRPPLDDVGEGVPLLLLHAFPLSRRMWRPQLTGLADSCRLLAPDLPGFGSSPPWAAAPRRLGDMAGGAAAVVCGLSMGGYVALALYEIFRERVRGLVLADTRAAADDETGRGRRFESAPAGERGGPPALAALASSLVPRLIAPRTRTARSELVAWL